MLDRREFTTACGKTIVMTRNAYRHMSAHQDVLDLLPEAIGRIVHEKDGIMDAEVDMGRVIGKTELIALDQGTKSTPMFFAYRQHRKNPTRIVFGEVRQADSSSITVIARPFPSVQGRYELVSAWIGKKSKKEPCDSSIMSHEEMEESLDFWCRHALRYDPSSMSDAFESTWDAVLGNMRVRRKFGNRVRP